MTSPTCPFCDGSGYMAVWYENGDVEAEPCDMCRDDEVVIPDALPDGADDLSDILFPDD